MAITAQSRPSEVSVHLSRCTREDADTVFTALCGAFASDRPEGRLEEETSSSRPTVWSTCFDVAELRTEPGRVSLHEPVTASLQGGVGAVQKLEDVLEHAFTVHEELSTYGDQEQDLRLRLESR